MINDKISIRLMKKIFDEDAKCKCSANCKMIYQSVLNHYFSDKITNVNLLTAFNMEKEKIKFDSFSKEFLKLEKAELITIDIDNVIFHSVWVKHMNISEFGTAEYTRITANEVKDELYQSHALNELVRMKYKVTIKRANELLTLFLKEQLVVETKYADEGQVKKHFVYWCQNNLDKISSSEMVKSGNKILGK